MTNSRFESIAWTPEQFDKLVEGTVLTLHYNDTNKGTFTWVHSETENTPRAGWRAIGQFAYDGDALSKIRDYLYESEGMVCRGSGAEPCCREMPEDEEWDEEDEAEDWAASHTE